MHTPSKFSEPPAVFENLRQRCALDIGRDPRLAHPERPLLLVRLDIGFQALNDVIALAAESLLQRGILVFVRTTHAMRTSALLASFVGIVSVKLPAVTV